MISVSNVSSFRPDLFYNYIHVSSSSCFSSVFFFPRAHPHVVGMLWFMSTKLAHSFQFCSCVCICLYGPFNCISFNKSSRRGDVVAYVKDINQPSLPTPFCSVLVSVSVLMLLSTEFHSINSPYNSPFSHSVLLVLFLPYWSFQLYILSLIHI